MEDSENLSSDILNKPLNSGCASIGSSWPYAGWDIYKSDPRHERFTFEELLDQISDQKLPEISKDEWNKIRPLLGSEDLESLQLAFEMLNGYHYPKGIMNMIAIKKALNKFVNYLNNK